MNTKKIALTVTLTLTVPVAKQEGPGRPSHMTRGEAIEALRNGLNTVLVKDFLDKGADLNEVPGRLVRVRVEETPVRTEEAEAATAEQLTPQVSVTPVTETPVASPQAPVKRKPGRPRKNPVADIAATPAK